MMCNCQHLLYHLCMILCKVCHFLGLVLVMFSWADSNLPITALVMMMLCLIFSLDQISTGTWSLAEWYRGKNGPTAMETTLVCLPSGPLHGAMQMNISEPETWRGGGWEDTPPSAPCSYKKRRDTHWAKRCLWRLSHIWWRKFEWVSVHRATPYREHFWHILKVLN